MSKVTAFIYLLFIATRRKRRHLMTQDSIYTTKLILVKKIYIFIVCFHPGSCPFMLSFSHFSCFLPLCTTIYNLLTTDYWLAIANNCIAIIGGSKIECVVNNKILREPVKKKCEKFHTGGGSRPCLKCILSHFKPF